MKPLALLSLLLLATPAFAQSGPQASFPDETRAQLAILQAQRNQAEDQVVQIGAKLQATGQQLQAAQKQIADLKAQLKGKPDLLKDADKAK